MSTKNLIAFLLVVILVFGIVILTFTGYILNILENKYHSITKSMTRTDVRKHLNNFKEVKVERHEVPQGYQDSIPLEDDLTIYRYEYIFSFFSIHVIYDKNENIFMKIPTYE